MKSLLLVFLSICFSSTIHAQNYQCLQAGVKHYFTNDNGYLRGIRIDSVITSGDSTIYYPSPTARGSWVYVVGEPVITATSSNGSWAGKKVIKQSNGVFTFDNLWGNTVNVIPQARLDSSWLFYHDTAGLYYVATVAAVDTITFLGISDSVKTITIKAYQDSMLDASDSLNGFQIILSKNNGFVQLFDLYTFPYHPSGTVYTSGRDFYLDMSLSPPYFYTPYAPSVNNSIYKLVTFINPVSSQLYASNIGDVYETEHFSGGTFPSGYTLDTIINKSIAPDSTTYTYSGIREGFDPATASLIVTSYGGSYTIEDSVYLFDTTIMPEEIIEIPAEISGLSATACNYYFPNDSSFCYGSPSYALGWIYGGSLSGSGYAYAAKIGFGQTNFISVTSDPSYWQDKLFYTNKNNVPCGSFYPFSLQVQALNTTGNSIQIFPNPATTSLTITSPDIIGQVVITNLLGQEMYSHNYSSSEITIDISSLQSGIYLIKTNDINVRKFLKE